MECGFFGVSGLKMVSVLWFVVRGLGSMWEYEDVII